MKAWGYWKSDYANAKYVSDTDPSVRSLPGRLPTIDTALERHS